MGFQVNKKDVAIDPPITRGQVPSKKDIKEWAVIALKFPELALPLAAKVILSNKDVRQLYDRATNNAGNLVIQSGKSYLRSLGIK